VGVKGYKLVGELKKKRGGSLLLPNY